MRWRPTMAKCCKQKYPITSKVDSRRPTPSPDTFTRHPDCLLCKQRFLRSTHTDVLAILLRLVDVPAVTSLCLLVVRFQNLWHQRGKIQGLHAHEWWQWEGSLARIKKINCASHACQSHQKGSLCARIWKRADQTDSTDEASTTDYGWNETENCLEHD